MYSSFSSRLSWDRSTWSNDSSCQTGSHEPESLLIDAPSRRSLEKLQNGRQSARPSLLILQRRKQKMHVVWHHHRCVQLIAFPVVMEAVLEHDVPNCQRKRVPIALAKSYE